MIPTEEDKRTAFRIDDSLPVIIRKVEDLEKVPVLESSQEDLEELSRLAPEETGINPHLWKMLVLLNKKMDWVLENLPVDLLQVKAQPINLSATGMRLPVNKKYNLEEAVRIKIILPTLPVNEIVLEAKVVRVTPLENGWYELALEFQELEDEVREELIQYSLKQQRKILLSQREQRGKNEPTPDQGS
jgi:hypothetical protein